MDLAAQIGRTIVRYVLKVARVQSAERSVNGVDEKAAMQKIQGDIERPYGTELPAS